MRGLADAEITLRGPAVDLHSGSFGGAVPNPLHAMAQLLAALHDEQGRVTLPGFYDKVRPLTDRERELMGRVPFDEQAWLAGPAASRVATGEEGYTTLERVGARPTAEVNGMWGGYTGPGHKTIIPAEAHAKLTFRLVADQRPEDVGPQLRAWVEANLPAGIEAEVHTPPGGVSPCSSDLDSPWMAALLRAIAQAWDDRARERPVHSARAAADPRPTWSSCSARRCSSSAPGCPPTASTRRTSGSCCRCSTAAPRRPPTCGASSRRGRAPGPQPARADDDGRAALVVGDHAAARSPAAVTASTRGRRLALAGLEQQRAARAPATAGAPRSPAGRRPDRPGRRRAPTRGSCSPGLRRHQRDRRRWARRARWRAARRPARAAPAGRASNRSPS